MGERPCSIGLVPIYKSIGYSAGQPSLTKRNISSSGLRLAKALSIFFWFNSNITNYRLTDKFPALLCQWLIQELAEQAQITEDRKDLETILSYDPEEL